MGDLPMDKEWVLKAVGGRPTNPDDFMRGLPEIRFSAEGEFEGNTGCNSFMGTYTLENGNLLLEPGAMSKMKCPGDGEANFLRALSETKSWKVDGDDLILLAEEKELLRFIPKTKTK